MDATRCLRDEHQVILRVLDCFEIALAQARQSGAATREAFEPFLEFFRGFADRCHHCKEEDRLFPCLQRQGLPREQGPIGVMLREHEAARARVRSMAAGLAGAESGDPASTRTLLDHASGFVELMRGHIAKEDHCLFDMADDMVRGDDLAELARDYRSAEHEPEYRRLFERCRTLADELAARYGVAAGNPPPA